MSQYTQNPKRIKKKIITNKKLHMKDELDLHQKREHYQMQNNPRINKNNIEGMSMDKVKKKKNFKIRLKGKQKQ